MDNTALQRFKDALGQNDRVAIVVGNNPNLDEMGAALSLYLSLKGANKATSIVSLSQPIVEHSSLVGIDEVRGTFGSASSDLVVSFPYQEGEIEKVSYTIENGLLNIVVKAGENGLTFQEQDVKFTRGGGAPSLVVVVGVPQLVALGDMLQSEALRDATIVNVDNDSANENFGDIVLVSPQYSSISELMANLILSNGLPIDVDGAQNLMYGISFATTNFQNPNTSYFAFEIAAELMRRGAVRVQTNQAPVQTPSFMQPQQQQSQPQSQPQPQQPQTQQPQIQRPPQQQRTQGMPRPNFNQPRNQQNQQRSQRNNQPQRNAQQPGQQQNQTNRQDEIRRALAEQARAMQQPQSAPQPQVQEQPAMPVMQPQQPVQQPQSAPQPQMTNPMPQPQAEAPSDWLTPKVYKGSSNPS